MFALIDIVWTIRPNFNVEDCVNVEDSRRVSIPVIGPVVPHIVAISTVPSIPSKLLRKKVKWN